MHSTSVSNSCRRTDSRGWSWAALAILGVAGTLVYAESFSVPFVFDGRKFVLENPPVRQLWPPWAPMLGTNRPIGFFSFAVNYVLHGPDVRGYHAVNLAIHVAAAFVLFLIVLRTLKRTDRMAGAAWGLALAVALVWMVHPLATQSVTYIYQRLESLMGLFYLLTLYTFIRGTDAARPGWWYAASVVSCGLGMGTKEVMVTAPLAVLWYDRALVAFSWREIFNNRSRYYAAMAGTWGILTTLMVSQWSKYESGGVLVVENLSPLDYALTQPGVILHYLQLAFWPADLCLDYAWPVAQTASEIVLPLAVIVGLVALMLWCAVRRPALGFVGGWFFLILGPTSSIAPIKDPAAEHRMYLPLAAVAVLVVVGACAAWRRVVPRLAISGPLARVVPAAVLLVIVASLGYRTMVRNRDYQSLLAIWLDTVEKSPHNHVALYNLAGAQFESGKYEEAIDSYTRAIALKPDIASRYRDRGVTYYKIDRYESAIADYSKAMELGEETPEIYYHRGNAYHRSAQDRQAIDDFSRAIALKPDYAEAYFSRGFPYLRLGWDDAAIRDYTAVIKLKPDWVDAYRNRAIFFLNKRQYNEAWDDVRMVRKLGGTVHPHFLSALTEASGRSE